MPNIVPVCLVLLLALVYLTILGLLILFERAAQRIAEISAVLVHKQAESGVVFVILVQVRIIA